MTVMEQYWIWLSSVEGIGAKRFYRLLSLYGDARSVWDALGGPLTPPDIPAAVGKAAFGKLRAARDESYFYRLFDRLEKGGIRAVTRLSDDYPPALTGIYDPPPTLDVRGDGDLQGNTWGRFSVSAQKNRPRVFSVYEIEFVVNGMEYEFDIDAATGAILEFDADLKD